jgi:hypothetical protein
MVMMFEKFILNDNLFLKIFQKALNQRSCLKSKSNKKLFNLKLNKKLYPICENWDN